MFTEYLGILGRPHTFIALGKGGVGKTTTAIALALELSRIGRTLLASFDPAKHLLKYLELPEAGRIHSRNPFHAYQFDLEQATGKLLKELRGNLESLAPSLKVLNAESVLKAARYTPGLEEDAIIRELSRLYRLTDYDYLVVDMPPTGLAIRVLMLPELYTSWLDGLIDVRSRILSLKYTIGRVRGIRQEVSDPVLNRLIELRNMYSGLYTNLKNPERTSFIIVANPEPLPLYEMKEITRALAESLDARPRLLVMNKVVNGMVRQAEYLEALRDYCEIPFPHACIPLLEKPPSTIRDVEALCEKVYDCCRVYGYSHQAGAPVLKD